ncbi:MAG: CBS domain-containing protein [Methanobrevibacter sp.]|jgi:predicted transcriptional regulator|nr:CBS domain-containing protein [Methanobrevibacter sp.]
MVKSVIKTDPKTKITTILNILDKNKISGLPVVGENNKLMKSIKNNSINF